MSDRRTYAPLFPVRAPEPSAEDCASDFFGAYDRWCLAIVRSRLAPRDESSIIRNAGDRWRFALVWRDEPRDQFTGVEHCACTEEL